MLDLTYESDRLPTWRDRGRRRLEMPWAETLRLGEHSRRSSSSSSSSSSRADGLQNTLALEGCNAFTCPLLAGAERLIWVDLHEAVMLFLRRRVSCADRAESIKMLKSDLSYEGLPQEGRGVVRISAVVASLIRHAVLDGASDVEETSIPISFVCYHKDRMMVELTSPEFDKVDVIVRHGGGLVCLRSLAYEMEAMTGKSLESFSSLRVQGCLSCNTPRLGLAAVTGIDVFQTLQTENGGFRL